MKSINYKVFLFNSSNIFHIMGLLEIFLISFLPYGFEVNVFTQIFCVEKIWLEKTSWLKYQALKQYFCVRIATPNVVIIVRKLTPCNIRWRVKNGFRFELRPFQMEQYILYNIKIWFNEISNILFLENLFWKAKNSFLNLYNLKSSKIQQIYILHAYLCLCMSKLYIYFEGEKTRVTFKLKMAMGHSTIGKKSLKCGRFFGRFWTQIIFFGNFYPAGWSMILLFAQKILKFNQILCF